MQISHRKRLCLTVSCCVLTQLREILSLVSLLIKSTNLIEGAPPSLPNYLPKVPPPNTITLGISTSINKFGGFPGDASGKEPTCQCRKPKRCGFDPWVGKSPWRRKWQPTPVFLPGESHGQRNLVGYSPWGCKESDMTEAT